jgi:hypothetical protein
MKSNVTKDLRGKGQPMKIFLKILYKNSCFFLVHLFLTIVYEELLRKDSTKRR